MIRKKNIKINKMLTMQALYLLSSTCLSVRPSHDARLKSAILFIYLFNLQ